MSDHEDLATVYRGLAVASIEDADANVQRGKYVGGFSPGGLFTRATFVVMERQADGSMLVIDEYVGDRHGAA